MTDSTLWHNYEPKQKLSQPVLVDGTTFHRGCDYAMLQRAVDNLVRERDEAAERIEEIKGRETKEDDMLEARKQHLEDIKIQCREEVDTMNSDNHKLIYEGFELKELISELTADEMVGLVAMIIQCVEGRRMML